MVSSPNPYQSPGIDGPSAESTLLPDGPIGYFRIHHHESWFACAFERWWRLKSRGLRIVGAVLAVMCLLGIATILLSTYTKARPFAPYIAEIVLLSAGSVAMFAASAIAKIVGRATQLGQFRNSGDLDNVACYWLFREGVVISGPGILTTVRWECFEVVCRFPDGLLLDLGGTRYVWLPWAELVAGNADAFCETSTINGKAIQSSR